MDIVKCIQETLGVHQEIGGEYSTLPARLAMDKAKHVKLGNWAKAERAGRLSSAALYPHGSPKRQQHLAQAKHLK